MVLALDCEVAARLDLGTVTIDPRVVDARLQLSNFRLRRVSNAKGPVVRELGEGLQKLIEHELKGPKLVAKLNRAIDKKRDRLTLDFADLLESAWRPLADKVP